MKNYKRLFNEEYLVFSFVASREEKIREKDPIINLVYHEQKEHSVIQQLFSANVM